MSLRALHALPLTWDDRWGLGFDAGHDGHAPSSTHQAYASGWCHGYCAGFGHGLREAAQEFLVRSLR